MGAETHYLDAIDAEESGDLEAALEHAKRLSKSILNILMHFGWSHHYLPLMVSIQISYKHLRLSPLILKLFKSILPRTDAWIKGGRLMVESSGST